MGRWVYNLAVPLLARRFRFARLRPRLASALPASHQFDVAVVGGGIVGTAAALALLQHRDRPRSLILLEAESRLAAHQSGRNSGVVHSGIYYPPGSLKAQLCIEGRRALHRFCDQRGVPYEQCGKVIVASRPSQLPALAELERRARANGLLAVRPCSPDELRAREPRAAGIAALLVGETGIVDFGRVTQAMGAAVSELGGVVRTTAPVCEVAVGADGFLLETPDCEVWCRNLINCAGLQSDRVAQMCGIRLGLRIIPFRGEYHRLRPGARHLVRHLIYPVPDPSMPFLGAHFTRTIDGDVEAGPNAVLAFARHGYRRSDVSCREAAQMLGYPGFWRMAGRHWAGGVMEMYRSLSARASLRALQTLVPSLELDDLAPGRAGVRAQAVAADGTLLNDFCIVEADGMLHVLNAPSPAATASLAIGRLLADRAVKIFRSPAHVVTGALG